MRGLRRMLIGLILTGTPLFAQTVTKVTVHVTGLVTFADTTAGGTPPPKTIYLMDQSGAASVHHIVPHIAVILAHDDYKPTVLDGRTLHDIGDAGSGTLHHWVQLTGAEKVSVSGGSSTALSYSEAAPASVCPADTKSLYFLPRLSRVSRKNDGTRIVKADLDSTYLNPKKADHRIAAFVDVTFGKLEADVVVPVVWDFKSSPSSVGSLHQQQIADGVDWTFDITGDTLILQTSTDGGAAANFIQFTADGDGEIELTLANAPDEPADVGVKALAKLQMSTISAPYDHHFPLYYEFLAKNVKHDGTRAYVRYLPVAAGVCHLDSSNVMFLDPDPCVLKKFIDMPDPGNCPAYSMMPPPEVDGINCGPDNVP